MNNGSVGLYGAGGHAKVIIDILKENNITVSSVYDDDKSLTKLVDIPVIHDRLKNPTIISIGNNTVRKKIVDKLGSSTSYTKAISTKSIISDTVKIGEGTVVMQGAIIQSSASIGKHTIVNTGATIDHDCIIGDFVHIAPGCNLCGNVQVGEGALIGAGSVIIPGIKIGKWSVVAAGSVVFKDIGDNVLAIGNPCRVIKKI